MKYVWWIVGAIVLTGLLVLVVILRPMTPTTSMDSADTAAMDPPATTSPSTDESSTVLASGRYVDYAADLVDDAGFQTTVLFFYAGWCPECRGYDMAINDSTVPDGTQILKVDYDNSQDLRQKYGVTIQSSFVRVNAAGEKQALWNGYGREKSLDAIIENTK